MSGNGVYRALPIIESCEGCGACCLVVTRPPYYHVFDDFGEEAWDRLRRERPDLAKALDVDYAERRANGGPFEGTPCVWYDAETRKCRHYEYRPLACQMFEINDVDCHDARRRAGVG